MIVDFMCVVNVKHRESNEIFKNIVKHCMRFLPFVILYIWAIKEIKVQQRGAYDREV